MAEKIIKHKKLIMLSLILLFLIVDPVSKTQLIYNGYIRYKALQKIYPDSDSDLNSHIRHYSWNKKTYIDFLNHNQNKNISYYLIRGSGFVFEGACFLKRSLFSDYRYHLFEALKDLESNRKGLEICCE